MIVKLIETAAITEDMRELFHFDENEFIIWYNRREKVKFFRTKHIPFKTLDFLDMLKLGTWEYKDALRWIKNNKL